MTLVPVVRSLHRPLNDLVIIYSEEQIFNKDETITNYLIDLLIECSKQFSKIFIIIDVYDERIRRRQRFFDRVILEIWNVIIYNLSLI